MQRRSPSRRTTNQTLASTKSRQPRRETGFPEPLDEDRNTTLPHPDADLSPGACISQDEAAMDRGLKHHKLSFLHKHRKNTGHSSVRLQSGALDSSLSLTVPVPKDDNAQLVTRSTSSLHFSKAADGDGAESHHDGGGDDDTPPTSPDVSEPNRNKGLFRKLRRKI